MQIENIPAELPDVDSLFEQLRTGGEAETAKENSLRGRIATGEGGRTLSPSDSLPTEGIRIVVCGSRGDANRRHVYTALDELHGRRPVGLLITAGAGGFGAMARMWAADRGVATKIVDCAGGREVRAREVIALRPVLCMAFPLDGGGFDVTAACRRAGIEIFVPRSL